jgi:hypothetical protein
MTRWVFDLPFANGYDPRRVPLHARRVALKQLMAKHASQPIKYSEDPAADGPTVLNAACEMGLEGIIAKRKDAQYVSTRAMTWLKVKCSAREELVVIGFVDRANSKGAEVGRLNPPRSTWNAAIARRHIELLARASAGGCAAGRLASSPQFKPPRSPPAPLRQP